MFFRALTFAGFRSLLLHKSIEKVDFRAVFRCIILALFCFVSFTSAHEDNFHLYPRSRAICKHLPNHGGKLARIHHVVAEFTNVVAVCHLF